MQVLITWSRAERNGIVEALVQRDRPGRTD